MVKYIVLLLCLSACAPIFPNGIIFNGFSDWEKRTIIKALEALPQNDATIRSIELSRLDPSSPYAGWACIDCRPCRIKIHPRLNYMYYWSVVWHEYGHCFGLRHSDNPRDIMAPTVLPLSWYTEEEKLDFLELLR